MPKSRMKKQGPRLAAEKIATKDYGTLFYWSHEGSGSDLETRHYPPEHNMS